MPASLGALDSLNFDPQFRVLLLPASNRETHDSIRRFVQNLNVSVSCLRSANTLPKVAGMSLDASGEMSQRLSQNGFQSRSHKSQGNGTVSISFLVIFVCVVCFPASQNVSLPISDTADFDDSSAVAQSSVVQSPSLSIAELLTTDFWGTDMWLGQSNRSYRPVAVALFWFQNYIGGGTTLPFRIANIALRAALCILVFVWYKNLSELVVPRDRVADWLSHDAIALLGALIFAAHPLHVDTYHYSVGQGDTLCAILVLAAVIIRMRSLVDDLRGGSRTASAVVCQPWQWWRDVLGPSLGYTAVCIMASTSKEIGAMLTVTLCCVDCALVLLPVLLQKHPVKAVLGSKYFARCCVLSAAWLAWMYVRLRVIQPGPPAFSHHCNVAAASPHWHVRWLTLSWAAAWHFASVLLPSSLSQDWGDTCITPISSLKDTRNCTTALVLFASVGFVRWLNRGLSTSSGGGHSSSTDGKTPPSAEERRTIHDASPAGHTWQIPLIFCVALSLVTFLPSSNIFFTVGFLLAERIMLLPSVGMFGVCVVLLSKHTAASSGGRTATTKPDTRQRAAWEGMIAPRTWVQWVGTLAAASVVGLLATRSVSRQIRLHDRDDSTLAWLEACPHSRKAWAFSAQFMERQGFFWTPLAQPHQRGCLSDHGWIHDCGLQRETHLKAAVNSLVLPPTNCSRTADASCHPLVYDISMPSPADHLMRIRDFCARSVTAKPPPTPASVQYDPATRHAAVVAVPFSIMSAGERKLCAAATGPDRHLSLIFLINLAKAHSPNVGPALKYNAMREIIMRTYELKYELGLLLEFDEDISITALIAYLQHFQERLGPSSLQAEPFAQGGLRQYVEHTRKWMHVAGQKAPYTLLQLYTVVSTHNAAQWLESVRMSAAAQAIRIDGVVNPPAFLAGMADLLLATVLGTSQLPQAARDLLRSRYSAARCANADTLDHASICRFCPFITQVVQTHAATAAAAPGDASLHPGALVQGDALLAQEAHAVGMKFGCRTQLSDAAQATLGTP